MLSVLWKLDWHIYTYSIHLAGAWTHLAVTQVMLVLPCCCPHVLSGADLSTVTRKAVRQ